MHYYTNQYTAAQEGKVERNCRNNEDPWKAQLSERLQRLGNLAALHSNQPIALHPGCFRYCEWF